MPWTADWNNGGDLAKVEQSRPDITLPGKAPTKDSKGVVHIERESDGVLAHVPSAPHSANWLSGFEQ